MLPPPGLPAALENAQPTPTTLLSLALTTAVSLALNTTSSTSSSSPKEPPKGECQLLGPFAILIQGALGGCAVLALVYKRWRERPQRPLKIWFFDVSKQVVGSVLVHIANLVMSMLSSGQFSIKLDASSVATRMVDEDGKYSPNPCSFYLLNLAIDTTLGIPILIFLLHILTVLFTHTPLGHPPQSIQSGNYGTPPRAWWWAKQSLIYFLGLMGMKICVLIIFLVLPWISRIGDWALRWTEGDEALQVIFVMLVFPVIMNATQYYIIDGFIKNQKPGEHDLIPDSDSHDGEDDERDHSPFLERDSDGVRESEDEDKELNAKAEQVVRKKRGEGSRGKALKTGSKDYDPLLDGESSPTEAVKATAVDKGAEEVERRD